MNQMIVVAGDCCLDVTRTGTVSRMSPECPECPVLVHQENQHDLGMAANIGQWLAAIPEFSVTLLGLSGLDESSRWFRQLCLDRRMKWIDLNRIEQHDLMTVKERIYARQPGTGALEQIARLDHDSDMRLNQDGYRRLEEKLLQEDPIAIIVADYGKGVFEGLWGEEAIGAIARLARKIGVPLFVNSKYPGRWAEAGATVLVCNREEFARAWPPETHQDPAPECDYLIVTKGEHGALLFDHPNKGVDCRTLQTRSLAQEVADVTGAGDAFLAGIVYQMLSRRRGFPYDLTCEDLETILIGGHEWASCCVGQLGVGNPCGGNSRD